MTVSPWYLCLEEAAQELLRAADALLVRHPRKRCRKRTTAVSRVFSAALEQLRGYSLCLEDGEQKRFLDLDRRLQERLLALEQHRIPPCAVGLYRQCRSLKQLSLREPQAWDCPKVLVGTLRRPSQLDVCLMHQFYHVPVEQIPEEQLPVAYVAIYQSRSLFQEECGIRFYGKVTRCTVVQRWQISEIPKESKQWYYRFEVDSWEQLENPIQVREVPIQHMFTNAFLLTHAQETPQLFLKTPAQYRFYQSIKTALPRQNRLLFEHPGGKVRMKDGFLQIRHRGRRPAVIQAEDFSVAPGKIFRHLMDVLEKNAEETADGRHQ